MRFKNILLVDDDEDDRDVFMAAVNTVSSEINCITLNGGHKALEYLSKNALPDLIFLDLNMPMITGVELLKLLNERYPSSPVNVYSTGSFIESERGELPVDVPLIITPDTYMGLITLLKELLLN